MAHKNTTVQCCHLIPTAHTASVAEKLYIRTKLAEQLKTRYITPKKSNYVLQIFMWRNCSSFLQALLEQVTLHKLNSLFIHCLLRLTALQGASHKVKSAQSNSAIGDNTSTAIASAAAATGAGGGLSDMRTLRKALSTSGFTLAFTAPITGVSPTMAPPSVSDLVAASAPPDHDSMMMGDDNVILDS